MARPSSSVIQGSFVGGKPRVVQAASVARPVLQAKPAARPPVPKPGAVPFKADGRGRLAPPPLPPRVVSGRGGPVQAKGSGDAFPLPPGFRLRTGGGQSLPPAVQAHLEGVLGASFADVRVHVGGEAASIGALAFTHGSDVYFAPGQYQPHTPHGLRLIGHELAHVVQQRAGRVRNPLGAGVAVVQDAALEAEAERIGTRVVAASAAIQARPAGVTARGHGSVHVSGPEQSGEGSYRIVAGSGGLSVGSVMLHTKGDSAIEVTDLKVDPAHRKQGLGGMLMTSVLRAGQRLGRSRVVLASQDSGSGRLTRWYRRMGFVQVGINRFGYPELEAPISRVVAGVAQACPIDRAGGPAARGPAAGVGRDSRDFVMKTAQRVHSLVIQRADKKYFKKKDQELEKAKAKQKAAEGKKQAEAETERERKARLKKVEKAKAKKRAEGFVSGLTDEKVEAKGIVKAWEINHTLFDQFVVNDPAGPPANTNGGQLPQFLDISLGSAFANEKTGLAHLLRDAIQDSLNTPAADRGVHDNRDGDLPTYIVPAGQYNERSFLGGGGRLVVDTATIPNRRYISLHYSVFYRVQ